MLEYAAERYPHIERHVSVQASATNEEAIRFYHRNFDVHRVVLPRVLSIHRKQLARVTPVPLEVFAFGSLCIMAEGRCYLSSYLTGSRPIPSAPARPPALSAGSKRRRGWNRA